MKLSALTALFKSAEIPDAELEARLLLSRFADLSDAELIFGDPQANCPALDGAIKRRLGGEPLAYILGDTEFFRESYLVTPDVLIPRSDTECLVEYAVRNLPQGARFVDLCTGSGCIAISTLVSRPDTTAVAIDISEAALAVAEQNAKRNGVSDRITLLRADVRAPLSLGEPDAVLCNPPYIARAIIETLSPEVRREPRLALDGGEDGLDFYRAMLTYLPKAVPTGLILFEIGYDQEEAIRRLADGAGLACEVHRDLGGNARVAVLHHP